MPISPRRINDLAVRPGAALPEPQGDAGPQLEDYLGSDLDPHIQQAPLLEDLLASLGDVQAPTPETFWEGLLVGGAKGLGGVGQRHKAERERFNEMERKRAAERDAQNLQATIQYRKDRAAFSGKKTAADQRLQEKQLTYERDNPIVDQALLKQYPNIAALKNQVGQRVNKTSLDRVALKSFSATDERATAAAERAAAAAARAAKLAEVNSVSKLADDYRIDPDISAYRTANQNLQTMNTAAKERSGAGDLALLISYVRATEPGVLSVVRQEELNNVSAAVGQLRRYMNIPNQWISGQRLSESGRSEILRAGAKIASSRKPAFDVATNQFRDRAKTFGVDPKLVLRDYPEPPTNTEVSGEGEFDYVPGRGLVPVKR